MPTHTAVAKQQPACGGIGMCAVQHARAIYLEGADKGAGGRWDDVRAVAEVEEGDVVDVDGANLGPVPPQIESKIVCINYQAGN